MAGAEALIILSLLGCDDSGAQCDFVRVGTERYETVEACRAASEPLLQATVEDDYPTVVAVCSPESAMPAADIAERPDETASGEDAGQAAILTPPQDGAPAPDDMQAEAEKQPGLLARVGDALASLAPGRKTLTKPIDVATDGAATVGGAVIVGIRRVADVVNPF